MDFDGNHDKAGMFEYFPEEIAHVFCKKSTDSIKIWHKGLVDKGFVTIVDAKRKLWSILNRDRYITGALHQGKAHQYAKKEKDCQLENILTTTSNFPENYKNFPPFSTASLKKKSLYIGSSKDQSNRLLPTPTPTPPSIRSLSYYQQVVTEEDYTHLTADDLMWIDKQKFDELMQ